MSILRQTFFLRRLLLPLIFPLFRIKFPRVCTIIILLGVTEGLLYQIHASRQYDCNGAQFLYPSLQIDIGKFWSWNIQRRQEHLLLSSHQPWPCKSLPSSLASPRHQPNQFHHNFQMLGCPYVSKACWVTYRLQQCMFFQLSDFVKLVFVSIWMVFCLFLCCDLCPIIICNPLLHR